MEWGCENLGWWVVAKLRLFITSRAAVFVAFHDFCVCVGTSTLLDLFSVSEHIQGETKCLGRIPACYCFEVLFYVFWTVVSDSVKKCWKFLAPRPPDFNVGGSSSVKAL